MDDTWQLQRAKAELSRVIDESIKRGPQTITRHGRPAAVVLSAAEYHRLKRRAPDFKAFLRKPPLHELELARSPDRGRKIRL